MRHFLLLLFNVGEVYLGRRKLLSSLRVILHYFHSQDGRLKVEDRLLQINDISLDGISNEKAMNAMRVAMKESIEKGTIKVIVSRKGKGEPAPFHLINERTDNKTEKSPLPNLNLNGIFYFNSVNFKIKVDFYRGLTF